MKYYHVIQAADIEYCHRLGRQTGLTRHRTMIERFKSELHRHSVYNARGQLNTFNKPEEQAQRIYINEDLTKRRTLIVFETRKLRAAQTTSDSWAYNDHIVIIDNNNTIKRINSPQELKVYYLVTRIHALKCIEGITGNVVLCVPKMYVAQRT